MAESLTAGHVQSLLASQSGASDFFVGGVTAYTLEQKTSLLRGAAQMVARCNGVSTDVARHMALGVRRLFQSHYAIATTGYAEPSPEWSVSQPFAWIAVATSETLVLTRRVEATGDRVAVQQAVAAAAIQWFAAQLTKCS